MKSVTEVKKIHDVRKSGDVQQTKWYMQKVPFYDEDYVYPASRAITYVINKQSGTYREYVCQVSKLQHMYVRPQNT